MENLNLTIASGGVYQVEGPNGSGKTTLLRILSGLSARFTGEVYWQGQPVAQVRQDFLANLIYLGHSAGIKAVLTPRENLLWHASLKGIEGAQAHGLIDAALQKVGLYGYEDAACFALSAGQQRRVSLARLFVAPARLWILDEPFTAIDKHGVGELEGWIAAFAESGGTVILTTHHQLNIEVDVNSVALGEIN